LGRLVATVLSAHPDIRVWLFRGSLGSGKTTAIRAVLRDRGVKRRVVSPTYTLAQYYPLPRKHGALHVDAYRLEHPREWLALGLVEAVEQPMTLVLVEWPERLRGFRWPARGEIKISLAPRGRVVRWAIRLSASRLRRRRR
jgi:tRNA threonylcarbamoyladenosine biosynthesis protein TsaE